MASPVIVLFAACILGVAFSLSELATGAPHIRQDDSQLAEFLRATYGSKASAATSWDEQTENNTRPGIKRVVCANHKATTPSRTREWLAVCMTTNPAAHGEAGKIDFYSLRESGGQFVIESSLTNYESGSSGVPGTVSVLALGSGAEGFRVEEGWVGQGQVIKTQALLASHDRLIVEVAKLRKGLDNSMMFEGDAPAPEVMSKKIQLKFDLSFDKAGSGILYPLAVRERGTECGRAVKRIWKLTFGAALWRYRIPKALMREECLRPEDESGVAHK